MENYVQGTNVRVYTGERKVGSHILTEEELDYIHSFAVDGIISLENYIKAATQVLNGGVKR